MRHFFPKVVSYNRFVKLEKAKNLNLNGQKQAKKVLKLVKKTYRCFFENVQCFFKNVQCFFQNNGMF